ncbi:MAG: hypothetical protein ACRDAU_11245 [Clostridium sp.]
MKSGLVKWVVLGVLIGTGVGVLGSYKLLNHETRTVNGKGPIKLNVDEVKNIDESSVIREKEALVKEINFDNKLFFDDMTLEKEEVYVDVFVFNKTKEMQIKDENYLMLNDEILGRSLNINGEVYGILNSLEPGINIYNDGIVSESTGKSEKINCFLIKAKVLENGEFKEIKKEKKALEEFLKYNKKNNGKSNLHEYEEKYKYSIDFEKVKKEVSKKEKFYEVKSHEVFNSDGKYYFLELFNKDMEITYVVGDREKDTLYTKKGESTNSSIKGSFLYNDEIYLLERKGDIFKIKLDKNNIKIVEKYTNNKRNLSAIEFNLIGIEGDNVYFRNSIPLDSLMSFNLKEKNFNKIYDSEYNTMENMDMKNGYITLYENPKESNEKMIGFLKDGKIYAKIKDINTLKDSTTRIYKDRAIIISTELDEKSKMEKTKIKILKL